MCLYPHTPTTPPHLTTPPPHLHTLTTPPHPHHTSIPPPHPHHTPTTSSSHNHTPTQSTLNVLNVAGNGIDSVVDLQPLTELTHFTASDNQLSNMKVRHPLSVLFIGDVQDNIGVQLWGKYCCVVLNKIFSTQELSHVLGQWPKLWKLELTGNPLCLKHKYRDRVITMCKRAGEWSLGSPYPPKFAYSNECYRMFSAPSL